MKLFQMLSLLAIPLMMSGILLHGMIKGVKLYDAFVEGAAQGFKTVIRIMPYLVAIFLAIGLFRNSGAMNLFIALISPITKRLGIPPEVLPLALMRPFSGSGALGMVNDLIETYGADSMVGRIGATMMGSSETIFFTMAVYFGAIGVKKSRHTVMAALLSHFAAVLASVILCQVFFS